MDGEIPKVKLKNEKIFVEVAKKMYEAEFLEESLNKNTFKSI